uniref:Nad4 n=1 Tax=Calcarina hispida TaxID=203399 RepID=UPI0023F417C1|nr:Nad4 [Calcarina hispida]WEF49989.1 Nad4 [Calcarina hispida]
MLAIIITYLILSPSTFLYSGFTWISLTLDNSNIGFIILIIILFPIINWISESETKSYQYVIIFIPLFILLLLSFLLSSLLLFFICYESLIILSFFILFIFIPSFYRIRTAFFSFLFSILGSINFILSLFYIISSISLFSLLLILPFLIKIPTFPFYYWLPEVHCEANTSISLFLAGLLLKLSLFGIIRFILCTFYLSLRFLSSILIYIILIGIIIINSSYFRYYDLKKIIALSSILHLNLTFHSMLSLNSSGIYCSIIIPLSHSLSSIALSLFMGLLINKTNTRLIDSLFFISSILRLLLSFFILSNNSFPRSINYIGELFALLSFISIDILISLFFLFISFLSTLFWFIVLNRKLPYHSSYCQSFSIYYLLLYWLVLNNYVIGIYWLFFIILSSSIFLYHSLVHYHSLAHSLVIYCYID